MVNIFFIISIENFYLTLQQIFLNLTFIIITDYIVLRRTSYDFITLSDLLSEVLYMRPEVVTGTEIVQSILCTTLHWYKTGFLGDKFFCSDIWMKM